MEKKGIVLEILILIIIYSIHFGSAAHDISPSSFSTDPNVNFLYNISVNNTDPGSDANLTEVSITIPSSFIFIEDSNGTDASSIFTNTSTVLSWENSTEYVINGSELKYFWFNAIAPTSGDYTFTVTSINETGSFSSNIDIEISSSTLSINFINPTPSHNSNLSQSNIPVNVSVTNDTAIDVITIYLYNSTHSLNSETSSSLPFYTDITGLDDGTYYINATVNDSSGNTDSTSTRKIILDTTTTPSCISNWNNCTNWSECIDDTQTRTCTDSNNCNDSIKTESQSCAILCTQKWNCSNWLPKDCPKNKTQTRVCTDSNNCGVDTDKPNETRSCTVEEKNYTSTIIIIIIILIVMGITIALIIYLKKQKPGKINSSNQSSGGYPPLSQTSPRPPRGPPPLQRLPRLPRRPIRRRLPQKPRAFQRRARYLKKYP